MEIRWVTAFVDRPAERFHQTQEFWRRVTGTTMSPTRGAHDEFATFVPPAGDAHLKIQRVADGPGGTHLDLHTEQSRALADRAIELGATELDAFGDVVVLRSPGGVVHCSVPVRIDGVRPHPVDEPGRRTLVDQVSVDVAPDRFAAEVEYWAALTGWELIDGVEQQYRALHRPLDQPLRFVFQRWGDDRTGDVAECHLDLACDDVATAVAEHVALGARVVAEHRWWTVMRDPSGLAYCLTARDPDRGFVDR